MNGSPDAGLYLIEAVGCAEGRDEAQIAAERGDAAGYFDAATATGEAPGRLRGDRSALAALGLTEGAVGREEALRLLRCLDPTTGESLGQRVATPTSRDELMRQKIRAAGPDITEEEARALVREVDQDMARTGSAFFDFTFSPSKSVSVYWAAAVATGDDSLAEAIQSSHREAVEHAMALLQAESTTRRYEGGSRRPIYERPAGFLRLDFDHSTSRDRDPHMHTHSALVAKVLCEDGAWRSVHSGGWKTCKAMVAAAYESRLAELIEERTPGRFELREDGMARELVGIDASILDASSGRTRQVVEAREKAVAAFRDTYGRSPSPAELRKIHRVAGLESRAAKSHDSPLEQLQAWAEASAVTPADLVAGAADAGGWQTFLGAPRGEIPERAVIREALAAVQAASSTWTPDLLVAEIERRLHPGMDATARRLAAEVLDPGAGWGVVDVSRRDVPDTPARLWDAVAERPVWRAPERRRFALADHLRAETQLTAAARSEVVEAWTAEEAADLVAEWRAGGSTITDEQAAAVTAVLTSPRAGDVLVAAAGAGKTYVAGAIAEAWALRGGTVMGTATSQIAAHCLADEGVQSLNATRLLMQYGPDDQRAGDRLAPGTLLVFDEANMTSLEQLRGVQEIAQRDGAKVLYFGDPRQLDAVGAGGGLAELARANGPVAQLDTVMRFREDWEKTASLRLRAGDVSVVEEYAVQGRIHAGTEEEMTAGAVDRAVADTIAGRRTVVITDTNGAAAEVAAAMQARLQELGEVGAEVVGQTMDGNLVCVGDRIQWRENRRDVDAEDRGELTNRELLVVDGVDDRGRVRLVREGNGAAVAVPSAWLEEASALAYSGTQHAVEGVTLDTGHSLVPGYVAMTRGKLENHAWLTTRAAADRHEGRQAWETSPTALFEGWAESAREAEVSGALETWRREIDAGESGEALCAAWEHSTRMAIRESTPEVVRQACGDEVAEQVTGRYGRDKLEAALTRAELGGHDRAAILAEAWTSRPVADTVQDMGALLAFRVEKQLSERAPERSAGTWAERAAGLAQAGSAVGAFVGSVAERLDKRVTTLGQRLAKQLPEWARATVGAVPELEQDQQEWMQRAGRIALYREERGLSDHVASIGARPHDLDVTSQMAWNDAARAAGRPVDELEYMGLPDSALEGVRGRWHQVAAHTPRYVDAELGQARVVLAQAQADLDVLRREALRNDDMASLIDNQALAVQRRADLAGERVAILEQTAEARRRWLDSHESDRDAAVSAERELKRRGRIPEGPQEEPEQLELFGITEEHTAAPEAVQDAEREVEPEIAPEEPALFNLAPTARDEARQQAAVDNDYVPEADSGAADVLAPVQAAHQAAEAGHTLAELEVQARYVREQLERKAAVAEAKAERDQVAEAARQDREATREVEREPVVVERQAVEQSQLGIEL